jgi:endo-1,4-beta-xylanase
VDRRSLFAGCLAQGAVIGIGAGLAKPARAATIDLAATPLKDLAKAKGLRFGAAVGVGDPAAKTGPLFNLGYQRLIAEQCDIVVPENELKMYVTHAREGQYNFAPGDTLLAFAEAHHIAMRGHNLIWARDQYTPAWLLGHDFGPSPREAAERLLTGYIDAVSGHYGDRLTSWDVVNEAVDPKTGHLRSQIFTRLLGPEALKIAYVAARRNLPHTQLVYNDYMSWEAGNETHRQGVLALLRWFRDHDAPVDALGVQSHLGDGFDLAGAQHEAWRQFLDQVVGLGYDLLITEFDVDDQHVSGDIATRDARVAATARAYLDQMLSYRQLKDILVWGLSDQYSWLQSFSPRPDGEPLRPTPYDSQFHAKPLRQAMAAALATASER